MGYYDIFKTNGIICNLAGEFTVKLTLNKYSSFLSLKETKSFWLTSPGSFRHLCKMGWKEYDGMDYD